MDETTMPYEHPTGAPAQSKRMTDETQDVTPVVAPTPAPSTENEPAVEAKKDDGTVPRHRLNEVEEKRKAAEAEAATAKASEAAAKAKVDALLKTLTGDKGEQDDKVAAFARANNIEESFLRGLVALTKSDNKTDPAAAIAVQEVRFNQELDALADAIPEAENLTREERKELKARAFSKEFSSTPLKTIYRDMMYDKRTETRKTFEESRGGGRQESESPTDFGKMTPEQMREWQNSNLAGRRRR